METEKMSFEEGLQSLKNQVAMLEKGNLPLDEALKVFRDAVDIGRFCNKSWRWQRRKCRRSWRMPMDSRSRISRRNRESTGIHLCPE